MQGFVAELLFDAGDALVQLVALLLELGAFLIEAVALRGGGGGLDVPLELFDAGGHLALERDDVLAAHP